MGTYKAPLGEPRVPKPSSQGGMKSANVQPLMKGRNGQGPSGAGHTQWGTRREGIGGSGAKNNPPRC